MYRRMVAFAIGTWIFVTACSGNDSRRAVATDLSLAAQAYQPLDSLSAAERAAAGAAVGGILGGVIGNNVEKTTTKKTP